MAADAGQARVLRYTTYGGVAHRPVFPSGGFTTVYRLETMMTNVQDFNDPVINASLGCVDKLWIKSTATFLEGRVHGDQRDFRVLRHQSDFA